MRNDRKRPPDASHWRLLGLLLRGRRLRLGGLGLVLLAGATLPLAGPQLLRAFIDQAVAGRARAGLALLAGAYVALALGAQAITVVTAYAATRITWTATNELRGTLARHVLSLDLTFHGTHPPGALIERADGDVTALETFLSSFVLRVVGGTLTLLGVLVVVTLEDWRVGLAMAGFAAVMAFTIVRQRDAAVVDVADERAAYAAIFGEIEERLAGSEDLRANAGGPHAVHRFHHAATDAYRAHARSENATARVYMVTSGVFVAGGALSLAGGAALLRAGAITLGTVFLLFQYTQLLRRPMDQIVDELQRVQAAAAGAIRIQQLLDLRPSVTDGTGTLPEGPLGVRLDGVRFAYGDGVPVLDGIDLDLRPGTVLGVVGRTGSGKTTLARLLLRLMDPTEGTVRMAGRDLRELRLDGLRARVGLVTQDVQLFQASVRDNLTLFGARAAGDAELTAILDRLGLGAWLRALPDGLDTPLGPGGTGASAGEAQLLAFARVFLSDPGLVILDEAASRLDPAGEARVERAIDLLLRDRTAVVIAHRLSTVERAGEILVLDRGTVVEHGPRLALAGDPGSRFAELIATGLRGVRR